MDFTLSRHFRSETEYPTGIGMIHLPVGGFLFVLCAFLAWGGFARHLTIPQAPHGQSSQSCGNYRIPCTGRLD